MGNGFFLEEVVELLEKTLIERTLERTGGNRSAASKLLGIHRNTLQRKMAEYHLGARKTRRKPVRARISRAPRRPPPREDGSAHLRPGRHPDRFQTGPGACRQRHARATWACRRSRTSASTPTWATARRCWFAACSATDATEAQVQEALEFFLEYYREHMLDYTVLYPGVREALDRLRDAGVRMAVLTNKPVRISRAIVDGLGVGRPFPAGLWRQQFRFQEAASHRRGNADEGVRRRAGTHHDGGGQLRGYPDGAQRQRKVLRRDLRTSSRRSLQAVPPDLLVDRMEDLADWVLAPSTSANTSRLTVVPVPDAATRHQHRALVSLIFTRNEAAGGSAPSNSW